MLVDAWLPRAAAAAPQRPAVGTLTYAGLLDAARAAARRLHAMGAGPGDRVAIALAPGEEFAEVLHACLLLGAVAVPIDLRLPAAEADRQAAGAAVVVRAAGELREAAPHPHAPLRDTHDLGAPAIIVHTSGTTGAPKPVALTYGNWLWSALGSAVALGTRPDERWLCCLPLSHVGGLSILTRAVIGATTVVLHERFDTERVLAALRRPDAVTAVSLVPTTLARLLDAGLHDPPALRCALLGGAPAGADLPARARAAGVAVVETYGMTEACSQVLTAGAPLFCTRVSLAPDGEILVAGPTVAPSAGPVLHTGDRGSLDADGRLRVTGRADELIITGGENVAPAAVEAVLEAHPSVAEALVAGRPDPRWGQAVVAAVVAADAAALDAEDLRAWCAERLAPHQVPKAFDVVPGPLPRTASGKLVRARLG